MSTRSLERTTTDRSMSEDDDPNGTGDSTPASAPADDSLETDQSDGNPLETAWSDSLAGRLSDYLDAVLLRWLVGSRLVAPDGILTGLVQQSRLYTTLTEPPKSNPRTLDLRNSSVLRGCRALVSAFRSPLTTAVATARISTAIADRWWELRHMPGRLLGKILALVLAVEYVRVIHPATDSTFGPLGRAALIGLVVFFLAVRLPRGTIRNSRTVRLLRLIFVPPR